MNSVCCLCVDITVCKDLTQKHTGLNCSVVHMDLTIYVHMSTPHKGGGGGGDHEVN